MMIHKLSIVGPFRPGNAKVKRARRGMEKNWNRYAEPLKAFLSGSFNKKLWLEYRKKKFATVSD